MESPLELRRRMERLAELPLRAKTARAVLGGSVGGRAIERPSRILDVDPGWALSLELGRDTPLAVVAETPWWPVLSGPAAEAIGRLWRHAVATSAAARRLASESGGLDPDRAARLGLLHALPLWALAVVAPERLTALLAIADPAERRTQASAAIGRDLASFGRELIELWGGDALLADVVWLHADLKSDLHSCGLRPDVVRLVQKAHAWAERTPWALQAQASGEPVGGLDPRVRLLIAEVQVRCSGEFAAADASAHEESVSRAHAHLIMRTAELERRQAATERFLSAFAEISPADDATSWADRAALAWCGEPGVAAARVVWHGDGPRTEPPGSSDGADERPARAIRLPLGSPSHASLAEVQLRVEPGSSELAVTEHPALAAWNAWATHVAAHERQKRRLDVGTGLHREQVERGDARRALERLDALAEFAAGAGHELNNPLAVILGRAQLLLGRTVDVESARALRAIIGQAQRAHRILRDLMAIARPPRPRPRPCPTDEVLRACLRDLQREADGRGVCIQAEIPEGRPWSWTDPDPLRQVAEVLVRNAIEATPTGGAVRVVAAGDTRRLDWTVRDSGAGLDEPSARHLFDPFFCGRQAGRGLGLGLPRAARFVGLAGGELRWRSSPGRGTTFHLTLPLPPGPNPSGEPPTRVPGPRLAPGTAPRAE
jgi:signal transduction histidine kinase